MTKKPIIVAAATAITAVVYHAYRQRRRPATIDEKVTEIQRDLEARMTPASYAGYLFGDVTDRTVTQPDPCPGDGIRAALTAGSFEATKTKITRDAIAEGVEELLTRADYRRLDGSLIINGKRHRMPTKPITYDSLVRLAEFHPTEEPRVTVAAVGETTRSEVAAGDLLYPVPYDVDVRVTATNPLTRNSHPA